MAQFWHTRGTESPIKWRNFGTLLPMTRKSSRVIIVPSKNGQSARHLFFESLAGSKVGAFLRAHISRKGVKKWSNNLPRVKRD